MNYKSGYAALVAYQAQQQKISLLVSSSRSAAAAGGEEVLPAGSYFTTANKQASMSLSGALTDSRMLLSHLYLAPGESPAWCATKIWQMAATSALTNEMTLLDKW